MRNYNPTKEEQRAITMTEQEAENWKDANAWVTDKIAFRMRNVIDRARKNYFGVFDNEIDTDNMTEKVWKPITETMVETVLHNIDLDTKDINVKAKNPSNIGFAEVARHIIKDQLHKMNFGELLDDIERFGIIDGTSVVKTHKWKNPKTGKDELKSYWVDLRNIYIDPNATSIQDTPVVIERSVITIDELDAYKDVWKNTDKVPRNETSIPVYEDLIAENRGDTPMVEIWERWGLMPKSLLTGKDKDKDEWIEGHIVCSNIMGKSPVCHLIEENEHEKKLKPYEEWRFKKIANRWYGRGVAEMLLSHQLYANMNLNMRKNVNLAKSQGLYEIRKGSGIKPSDLKKLISGGGIQVNQLGEDIRPFQDRDFHYQESMNEEQNIMQDASLVTGANEMARGEMLPATTSATSAAIQNINSQTRWRFLQEGLGMFLKRLIEDHYLPIMKELMSASEILRITGDVTYLAKFDENLINLYTKRQIANYVMENGKFPSSEQITMAQDIAKEKIAKQGKNRFIKGIKQALNPEYDVEIFVTGEEFDKISALQNLQAVMMQLSQLSPNIDIQAVLADYFDMLGMDSQKYFKQQIFNINKVFKTLKLITKLNPVKKDIFFLK